MPFPALRLPTHQGEEPDLFADWEVGIAKILRTIETDMYSAKHGLTPAPLEHLTWLMDFCDSPPYGHFLDPTREFDLPSRASQMFGMRIPPANIADILNGAPVEPMPNDPNLEEWATANTHEQHDSIDGFWSSRWRATGEVWQNGRALFRTVGDWVTIEVQDEVDQYIIRARRDEASRIVGRYMNCVNVFDTSPWVGVIVDDTRIDGFWYTREERYGGSWHQKRWDFRR